MVKAVVQDAAIRAYEFLRGRKLSYQRTFDLTDRDVEAVLADLAKFCRANESTYNLDPRMHALLEGRREVWLRITQHLNLTSEQLYQLYAGRK